MDMAVIVFVIFCMLVEGFDLNSSIDVMVVKPVEKMLGTVSLMAKILSTVVPESSTNLDEEDVLNPEAGMCEAHSLEHVFKKLLCLVAEFYRKGMVDLEELEELDDESKGVILEVMMLGKEGGKYSVASPSVIASRTSFLQSTMGNVVQTLPVPKEVISSWDLDILQIAEVPDDLPKVMMHIFFDSTVGEVTGRVWADLATFRRFHEQVRFSYLDNPYHNYKHACDVVATVFRFFMCLRCVEWMRDNDMYALLVAALCHDIGHPGRTTPFLVETKHELAIRYNDTSPLENMHCAKLFEICGSMKYGGTDVFQKFDKDMYRAARKLCINAIIHTDNALHFDMVKAVKSSYEVTSDLCDMQSNNPDCLSESYKDEVLKKNITLWQQLILHMCDVATPLKPWLISRKWATLVQDEFFAQGDEEKELGIPVGMLNDSTKVSRSGSEHGFINFLLAPLTLAAVSNFPPLHSLAVQMVSNMQSWRDLWVQDTKPSPDEIARRDADVAKIKEQVEALRVRKPASTIRTKVPNFTSMPSIRPPK